MNERKLVCISGNIASGKTSLADLLYKTNGWHVIPEPNEENPFLERFYINMRRWAFHSQIFFLTKRFALYKIALETTGIIIQDRTIFEDSEIFVRYLFLSEKLEEDEYKCYQELYQNLLGLIRPPNLIVYLYATPEVLINRIKKRGRNYEKRVSETYIKGLNKLYEEWANSFNMCPIIKINTSSIDYIHNPDQLKLIIQEIVSAFGGLGSR